MRGGKAVALVIASLVTLLCFAAPGLASSLTPTEQLGKALFFDKDLSEPAGQSCATCHAPKAGWTGPRSSINAAGSVYPGAVATRFGNRKPPTAAYGGGSPILWYDEVEGLWLGGMFWDGRATGRTLGDPLAEQALGPFLNPLEQNMASAADVIAAVKASDYADLFEQVWGDLWADTAAAYNAVGRSIAAYERSSEVSPFTSKYDAWKAGKARLTPVEAWGYRLFTGKGKCDLCHAEPLFTDFSYDNLGVPKNPMNPFYSADPLYNPDGANWVDPGLGGFLESRGDPDWAAEYGKHKVPTLRNVDKRPSVLFVKAYAHNGYFKSLWKIVHFYNTRDVLNWPAPEVAENVNTAELGDLGLTLAEELAIVAFMKTLSDGYLPTACH